MEINTKSVLAIRDSLKAKYSSLEGSQLNLFANLANICSFDWNDGHSIRFSSEVEQERLECDRYRHYVLNKVSIFDFIYNKYSSIGATIKCDLSKKGHILAALDASIAKVDVLLNELSRIDLSYPYPEFGVLRSKQQEYVGIRRQLSDIRDYFDSLFSKIKGIETEIAAKIRSLEDFKTKKFSFDLVGKGGGALVSSGTLDEKMFSLDCAKVKLYKDEEKTNNNGLYKGMSDLKTSYISDNVNLYLASLVNLKNTIKDLYEKRDSYLRALELIPPLYGFAAQKTVNEFNVSE